MARSSATACVLAVLLVGCLLLASAADARRLLYHDDDGTAMAMPPAPSPMAYAVGADDYVSPALAPAPESGADGDDDGLAGRMLFRGRGLLDSGIRLAGRLLLGVGL